MTFIRQNACLRSWMTACGNARYVAAHCRGVIILISRSTYSLPAYFYPDNFSCKRYRKTWLRISRHKKREALSDLPFYLSGAGEESRTLDLNLGKVALYQLSYSRIAYCLPYHATALLRLARRRAVETGAGEESRTLDLNLGKVALYQLSYSRISTCRTTPACHFLTRKKRSLCGLFLK